MLATGFSVVVDDLRATAVTFGGLRDRASSAAGGASASLAATAGAGGDDAVLARWRDRYDPMAVALWGALVTAGVTLGSISGKLTDTGNAYLAGEHAATPGASGVPPELPGAGGPVGSGPPPPSSTGPDGIPDVLASFYPGGDPGRLRAASAAWTALAEEWTDLGLDGDSAFRRPSWSGTSARARSRSPTCRPTATPTSGNSTGSPTGCGQRTGPAWSAWPPRLRRPNQWEQL